MQLQVRGLWPKLIAEMDPAAAVKTFEDVVPPSAAEPLKSLKIVHPSFGKWKHLSKETISPKEPASPAAPTTPNLVPQLSTSNAMNPMFDLVAHRRLFEAKSRLAEFNAEFAAQKTNAETKAFLEQPNLHPTHAAVKPEPVQWDFPPSSAPKHFIDPEIKLEPLGYQAAPSSIRKHTSKPKAKRRTEPENGGGKRTRGEGNSKGATDEASGSNFK